MNNDSVWREYYNNLRGAKILSFIGMSKDETNPYDEGFPQFLVRFADDSIGMIEISQDPEGNGGGFIFGLPLPKASN